MEKSSNIPTLKVGSCLVEIIEKSPSNIRVSVALVGSLVACVFRLNYYNETPRSNSKYKVYRIATTYFEGFENLPRRDTLFLSYETAKITDLCLYVERNAQALLENVMAVLDKQ